MAEPPPPALTFKTQEDVLEAEVRGQITAAYAMELLRARTLPHRRGPKSKKDANATIANKPKKAKGSTLPEVIVTPILEATVAAGRQPLSVRMQPLLDPEHDDGEPTAPQPAAAPSMSPANQPTNKPGPHTDMTPTADTTSPTSTWENTEPLPTLAPAANGVERGRSQSPDITSKPTKTPAKKKAAIPVVKPPAKRAKQSAPAVVVDDASDDYEDDDEAEPDSKAVGVKKNMSIAATSVLIRFFGAMCNKPLTDKASIGLQASNEIFMATGERYSGILCYNRAMKFKGRYGKERDALKRSGLPDTDWIWYKVCHEAWGHRATEDPMAVMEVGCSRHVVDKKRKFPSDKTDNIVEAMNRMADATASAVTESRKATEAQLERLENQDRQLLGFLGGLASMVMMPPRNPPPRRTNPWDEATASPCASRPDSTRGPDSTRSPFGNFTSLVRWLDM
eukprot:jgi/Mesvir1/7332/Mv19142-RA.1